MNLHRNPTPIPTASLVPLATLVVLLALLACDPACASEPYTSGSTAGDLGLIALAICGLFGALFVIEHLLIAVQWLARQVRRD